ncbi:hypothetical protein [Puniceibacterium confluentis]|uniref:hypothetical protein n=1 Tax=Puniceibacterium confluentis TaxID=1958944 RepID=UPI0011B4ADAD|nr:hypothetical protein [Puniceibacterium confluentis]
MNTTELAKALGLSKGRISQYVSAGKLDGCYSGDGRARRFDLGRVKFALKQGLDAGQLMGNGAETRKRIKDAATEGQASRRDGELPARDPDRYELARTQKAEEEARRLRRQNQVDEGTLVLADKAAQATARALAQEIAEFESVMRRGARAIADQLGVDFKTARQILVTTWREHRQSRSALLAEASDRMQLDQDERDADI